ncbi:hypothetical protein CR513_37922, partial [Mucuna pruriens]
MAFYQTSHIVHTQPSKNYVNFEFSIAKGDTRHILLAMLEIKLLDFECIKELYIEDSDFKRDLSFVPIWLMESKDQVFPGSFILLTVLISLKHSHGNRQGVLASVGPPSTTIAMVDNDGSPRIAKMLRIKSTRMRW